MLSAQEIMQLVQSLVWLLAGVGVFIVGMNFMKFESASRALRDSRIETALTELQRTVQIDMDKGKPLSGVESAEDVFFRYVSENNDVLSVMIFSTTLLVAGEYALGLTIAVFPAAMAVAKGSMVSRNG